MRLENKVSVITGASKGIGKSIAKKFAIEGSKVSICSRSSSKKEGFKVVKTEGVGLASFSTRILKYFYKSNNLKILLSVDILLSKTLKHFCSESYNSQVTKSS